MLMAVNIGNSRICIGIFEKSSETLITRAQIATDLHKSSDEYSILISSLLRERGVDCNGIEDGIVSSVVPQLTETMKDAMASLIKKTPLSVGPGAKTGFPIKIDNPSELGGDIVADAAAVVYALKTMGKAGMPAVVAHVGTVTTVSAINQRGEFVGCSIFPGVRLSFDMLHGKTALLPNVSLERTERAIAKNSQDSVRSGVIFGQAMMLDGFAERFAKEMKCSVDRLACFITGRDAKYVMGMCERDFVHDEHLTLKGLCRLFCNASSKI